MKKAIVMLSVMLGMPLLGCATQQSNRQVSSDGQPQVENQPSRKCSEYETKREDGSCERIHSTIHPMRKGSF